MHKNPPLFALLVLFAIGVSLAGSTTFAEDESKEKTKEKAPPKEKKSSIEWEQAATISGTIKNTTTVIVGSGAQLPRQNSPSVPPTLVIINPVRHDFSVEGPVWRIKWNIETTADRGAKLKTQLYKEEERGRSKEWKKKGLVQARPGQESEQVFTLGPGNYYLELTGNDVKYTFTVEVAQKAAK